jgi:hypothetical protein
VAHELGILLVHGIGNQRQGDTLVRWGDAIGGWLRDWGGDPRPPLTATFESIRLHPPDPEPAQGTLRICGADGTVTWALAEAWWADDFSTPGYRALAVWSVRALPTTLFGHVADVTRRALARPDEAGRLRLVMHRLRFVGRGLAGFAAMAVLAPLVVALLLVVLAVGLLPIPALRRAIAAVQRQLTGTVGDSLILLESPVQAAAMTHRVVAGIQQLRQQGCRRVVVVAHSQGAAVAIRALAEGDVGIIDGLVTVGSGITKLQALAREATLTAWLPAGLTFLTAALSVPIIWALRAGEVSWQRLLLIVTGWALLFLGIPLALMSSQDKWRRTRAEVPVLIALVVLQLGGLASLFLLGGETAFPAFMLLTVILLGGVAYGLALPRDTVVAAPPRERVGRWLDLWSRADPVPNGPTRTATEHWPTSIEVRNLDSVIRDHSAYLEARDDALAHVVTFLLATAGPVTVSRDDADLLIYAGSHREWRMLWLRGTRWVAAASVLVFLWRRWSDLEPATERVHRELSGIAANVPVWLPWPASLDGPAAVGAGALGVVAAGGLLYAGMTAVWQLWNQSAQACLFRGGKAQPRPRLLHVLVAVWCLVVLTATTGDRWLPLLYRDVASWSDVVLLSAVACVELYALGWVITAVAARRRDFCRILARHKRRAASAPPGSAEDESGSPPPLPFDEANPPRKHT